MCKLIGAATREHTVGSHRLLGVWGIAATSHGRNASGEIAGFTCPCVVHPVPPWKHFLIPLDHLRVVELWDACVTQKHMYNLIFFLLLFLLIDHYMYIYLTRYKMGVEAG